MDAELLRRKAGQVERALERVEGRLSTAARLAADLDGQDIVFRNLQLAVQSAVDMAVHVIVSRGLRPPKGMSDAFTVLVEARLLAKPLEPRLRRLVALRNILVHDYARVDVRRAHAAARGALKVLPRACALLLRLR